MPKAKIIKFLKFLPFLASLIVVVWFLVGHYFLLTGQEKITYLPHSPNRFIKNYAPQESPLLMGDGFSLMTEDNNTFEVSVPDLDVSQIDFKIYYQNPDQQPELKVGVLTSDRDYNYHNDYQEESLAVTNSVFDALSLDKWQRQESNDLILWQRLPAAYQSIDNFLSNPPTSEKILTYNYQIEPEAPQNFGPQTLNVSLKDSYQFWTYLFPTQELDFNFLIQNLNQDPELPTDFQVSVWQNGQVLATQIFPASSEVKSTDVPDSEQPVHFINQDLSPGAYLIKIEASDNIITKKISTPQSQITFTGSLELVSEPVNLNLFSASQLELTPLTESAIQEVIVGAEKIDLKKKKKVYTINNLDSSLNNQIKVSFNKSGVLVNSNGYLSFSPAQAFLPYYPAVSWNNSLNENAIDLYTYDYLIANYRKPGQTGDWLYAGATLDLEKLNTSGGYASFKLIAPHLKEEGKKLYIGEIEITFKGRPQGKVFKRILNNFKI